MTEAPPDVWRTQERSDWEAARRVLDEKDESTYCQAISKYQQTVEKSVKMVLAALRDQGRSSVSTGRDHRVEGHMKAILEAFRLRPPPKDRREPVRQFGDLLVQHAVHINSLCSLAPKWPAENVYENRDTGLWPVP